MVGNTDLSRESGEPYPASHFANAHSSAGQGTSPVSQNNFCGCSPPLWLLFVGFPCFPDYCRRASSLRSTACEWGRWARYKNSLVTDGAETREFVFLSSNCYVFTEVQCTKPEQRPHLHSRRCCSWWHSRRR